MALKPTTVRFVPDEATSADELAIAALHLYAYKTAAALVRPEMRVLDIGFGEGYGSTMVTAAGGDYLGVEVDPDIVEHARTRYEGRFEVYDGTTIDGADGSFDLVLAFQVIAYLDDPQPWLREIRRLLDPGGLALISTPNRVYRLFEGQRPWNRYHVREYTSAELESVLGRVFPNVTVYGIVASEPIDAVVRARADRARKLARLDPLGLRYRLPESINAPLRRILRRTAQPVFDPADYSVERVRHDLESAETGLDLLAFVRS